MSAERSAGNNIMDNECGMRNAECGMKRSHCRRMKMIPVRGSYSAFRVPHSALRTRGSVLIMVVALLVLIALIATAMISTTRNDRFASVQHQQNVQIDLLVQGAKDIAVSAIVNDIFGTVGTSSQYRPGDGSGTGSDYDPFDAFTTYYPYAGGYPQQNDNWLMPRTPTLQSYNLTDPFGTPAAQPSGSNYPIWACITGPLAASGFESPLSSRGPNNLPAAPASIREARIGAAPPYTYAYGRSEYVPTQYPNTTYPALQQFDPSRNEWVYYVAGDTDGDGMADAMLQRLPMGPINGVSYYVAYRIVDNNSALNVNTATSVRADFVNNGAQVGMSALNLAIFPSSIGILEVMRQNNSNSLETAGPHAVSTMGPDLVGLLTYRNGGAGGNDLIPDGVYASTLGPKALPRDDNGTQATTYRYLSLADATWQGLGRRLGNPGVASGATKHQVFSVSDAMSLAYPFAIRPRANSTSTIEQFAPQSFHTYLGGGLSEDKFTGNPAQVNDALGLLAWYTRNFDWFENDNTNSALNRPLRTIATSFNPVSNASSRADVPLLSINYINAATGAIDLTAPLQGFGDSKPRASLNTASFPTLMRAYFGVMAENWTGATGEGSPFTSLIADFTTNNRWTTTTDPYDPYHGMKWEEPVPAQEYLYPPVTTPSNTSTTTVAGYQHPARMFRSSLRAVPESTVTARPVLWPNTTPRLRPDQMVLLRAAISAANAKELRDNDDHIDPVEVPLNVSAGAGTFAARARIFGTERQPFISEVYVQTDHLQSTAIDYRNGKTNANGYIAIELYNPYPFPIDLFNCKLTSLNRTSGGGYPLLPVVSPVAGGIPLGNATSNMAGAVPAGWSSVTIPPYGYLVLENYDPNGNPLAAKYRPGAMRLPDGAIPLPADTNAPGATMWAYVPQIESLIYDREFFLVRPTLAVAPVEGTPVAGRRLFSPLTYTWEYNTLRPPAGSSPQAIDMAPIDSFDFTGLRLPNVLPPDPWAGKATAWHYARPTPRFDGTTGLLLPDWTNWQFVYPGRYNAAASVPDATTLPRPRHQGVQEAGYTGKNYFTPGARDPWEPAFSVPSAPPLPMGESVDIYPPTLPAPAVFQGLTFGNNTGEISPNQYPTYDRAFTTQLNNLDQPGPFNRIETAFGMPIMYPFGGFARNGDALDVTFFGAYRIVPATAGASPTTVLEWNTVSMDAAYVEDTDLSDDPQRTDNGSQSREQLGRFCPLDATFSTTGVTVDPYETHASGISNFNAYQSDLNGYGDTDDANPSRWRYRWASDLLDYVTVQSPNDDYAPSVLPSLFKLPGGTLLTPGPVAVSNSGSPAAQSNTTSGGVPLAGVNEASESGEPVHGLVNLNTASWQVLAMIPWFNRNGQPADQLTYNTAVDPPTWQVGANGIDDNAELAQAIVYWRDGDVRVTLGTSVKGNGPFRSIYDLNRVRAVRDAQAYLLGIPQGTPRDPDDADGDLSPFNYGVGGLIDDVRHDYEERFLLFKRVSNLLTVRSDSFTVYLVVQGWRNPGTANPELVTQRRAAMIVDRSRCTPGNPTPTIYNIPTQQ